MTRLDFVQLEDGSVVYDPREGRLWVLEHVARKARRWRCQVRAIASNWLGDVEIEEDGKKRTERKLNVVVKPYGFFKDVIFVGTLA